MAAQTEPDAVKEQKSSGVATEGGHIGGGGSGSGATTTGCPQLWQRVAILRELRSFIGLVLLILAIVIGWYQLNMSQKYEEKAARQRMRSVYIPAKRGIIADRNGIALNYTMPSYALVLRPEMLREPGESRRRTIDRIETLVADLGADLGPEFYSKRPSRELIAKHIRNIAPMPLHLWEDLDEQTIARWNARRARYPGTEIFLSWKRCYYEPQVGTQWRGSTRFEQPADPEIRKFWNANSREPVGIDGVEGSLNSRLRGEGGYEILQTDALSYRQTVLEAKLAKNGEDVVLSMDLELQKYTEELFISAGYRGALVLLDSQTSEVLVMCSVPVGNLERRWEVEKTADVNRCLSGYYPPGSTLKPLVALCALKNDVLLADDEFTCDGSYPVTDDFSQKCSSRYGHGNISLARALAASCNVYFCNVGVLLGESGFDDLVQMFVLGRPLCTELWRQEQAGIGFCPAWVMSQRNDKNWSEFDSANASIGQGGWIVTPMQMAVNINGIATGRLVVPKLLLNSEENIISNGDWTEEQRRLVLEGMRQCVEGPGGTGHALRIPGVIVYGKTGTAEVGKNQRPHAWCVAIAAPDADGIIPKYTGVCVVENAGGGGKIAAPILQKVLQKALEE